MKKILVIGSTNVDITAVSERIPLAGETIGGASLIRANGGKGANQAVTIGRLGGDVRFATSVGNDNHGYGLKDEFISDGIDTSFMRFSQELPTGTALILVDKKGENCISVAPGANEEVDVEFLSSNLKMFDDVEFILIQLEIPMESVEYIAKVSRERRIKVVLNPAPYANLSDTLLESLWLITPNQTETESITGIRVDSQEDAAKAASVLHGKGVSNVIITMGSKGAFFSTPEQSGFIPSRKVEAVDTTAAGDVFNGALVKALADNMSISEAAAYANVCASISVTRLGSQTSIPTKKEVEIVMNSK